MARGRRPPFIWIFTPNVVFWGGENVNGDGGNEEEGEVVVVEDSSVEADDDEVEDSIIGCPRCTL